MFELFYDSTTGELYKVNGETKEKKLIADMASEPSFCPSRKNAVYINPLAWECEGELFLINLEDGLITKLDLNCKEDFSPKFANWIDDNNFIVIIGFIHGTVSIGGNVHIVNVYEGRCDVKLIDEYEESIQVTSVDILKNGDLLYTGIEYIDDNWNSSIPYRHIKKFETISDTLVHTSTSD